MMKFKTVYKETIAQAYNMGYDAFMRNLEMQVSRMSDADILLLGVWQGKRLMLPVQVSIIVKYLGEPEIAELICIEQ
jgi:hypothetical protein